MFYLLCLCELAQPRFRFAYSLMVLWVITREYKRVKDEFRWAKGRHEWTDFKFIYMIRQTGLNSKLSTHNNTMSKQHQCTNNGSNTRAAWGGEKHRTWVEIIRTKYLESRKLCLSYSRLGDFSFFSGEYEWKTNDYFLLSCSLSLVASREFELSLHLIPTKNEWRSTHRKIIKK